MEKLKIVSMLRIDGEKVPQEEIPQEELRGILEQVFDNAMGQRSFVRERKRNRVPK